MRERRFERAMERLLDDETLTDELVDHEARFLLKWAEGLALALAQRDLDDPAFDEATYTLRRLVRHINRLTGQRQQMNDETQKTAVTAIIDDAQSLGYEIQEAGIANYLRTHHTLDNVESMRMLTACILPPQLD